jgi:chromosome segregation ATPase
MIDSMTALLKEEQTDDDSKKEYCEMQFDQTEDKKKELDIQLSDENKAIASAEESIATLTEEIKALAAGIAALDKSVAEATEQRKQENVEFKALMSSDTAAKEIMKFAKNRLNKFYNPKLYKPPPKKELSAEDRIVENMGAFVQVSSETSTETAPPPPPETFGAYKKSGKSTGVIAMIDLLIADLDKEMTEAKQEEKDAQADYEEMMKDSAEKRTLDSKASADKAATKADTEAELEATKGSRKETLGELYTTGEYMKSLHGECDWLMMNYDARKEARTGELDSLVKAKAILSGADYSLLQATRQTRYLRTSK